MVFDGGNTKLNLSAMDDIGKGVATAVLKRHDEKFRNKLLLMHTVTCPQNKVLGLAEKILPDKP